MNDNDTLAADLLKAAVQSDLADFQARLEELKYKKHIKAQIRKGKMPRYTLAKDPDNDSKLERKLPTTGLASFRRKKRKLTMRVTSTLSELTKK